MSFNSRKSASGQLQNIGQLDKNTVNSPMSITIDRVIIFVIEQDILKLSLEGSESLENQSCLNSINARQKLHITNILIYTRSNVLGCNVYQKNINQFFNERSK